MGQVLCKDGDGECRNLFKYLVYIPSWPRVKTVHPFFRVSKPLCNRSSRGFNLRYTILRVEGPHSALALECTRVVRDSAVHMESPLGTNRERHGGLAGRPIL